MDNYKQIILDYLKPNISRIFSLLDRNPYSRTYGCFDREFWHYKSKSFFNGMSQCYLLSLALIYSINFEGNKYYHNPILKDYIIGTINFSIKNLNKNGSLDEHYYNESSFAATVFVLYCITEVILRLNLNIASFFDYFKK